MSNIESISPSISIEHDRLILNIKTWEDDFSFDNIVELPLEELAKHLAPFLREQLVKTEMQS